MIKKSSDCITKNKQIREILSENIYQTPRLKIMKT